MLQTVAPLVLVSIIAWSLFPACSRRGAVPAIDNAGVPVVQGPGSGKDPIGGSNSSNTQSSTIQELQETIEDLNKQLASDKTLSAQDRADLQQQLEETQRQKRELEDLLKKAKEQLPKNTPGTPPLPPVTLPIPGGAPNSRSAAYSITYNTDCLDVASNSTADGAAILSYPCNGQSNQKFVFEFVDTGTVRIIAQNSLKCVVIPGASTSDGTAIAQQTCRRTNETSEIFRFVDVKAQNFKLQNTGSNLCLKIGSDGTVFQSDCNQNYTVFTSKP